MAIVIRHSVFLGETGAGKTTLLNLLLGIDFLPVETLSSTSVITEIKYGARRYARAHYKKALNKPPVQIELEGTDDWDAVLSPYLHQKDLDRKPEDHPYATVELFWPILMLETGCSVVDSPGVGENAELTEAVLNHMRKAFGFVYIMNATTSRARVNRIIHTFIEAMKNGS